MFGAFCCVFIIVHDIMKVRNTQSGVRDENKDNK